MYGFFNRARPTVTFTVSGAFPAGFLNLCAAGGVEIISAQALDDYTLCVCVPQKYAERVKSAAVKSQCTIGEMKKGGSSLIASLVLRRIVPAALLFLLLGLLAASKLFIWEIEVIGNERVTDGEILAALDTCGVELGSYWPAFTSDSIRSEVMSHLHELSFITVNVYGSRAEVIVRERIKKPDIYNEDEPADIIAGKTGIITEMRVLSGIAAVTKGKAVMKGETLISGGVPGRVTPPRILHSLGTVKARTYYELSAKMPLTELEKRYTGRVSRRFALLIGNKRINFYGNSSISEASCDKICKIDSIGIKGLFSLPAGVAVEESRYYETAERETDPVLAKSVLESALHERLLGEIDGGDISYESFSYSLADGVLTCCLRAECEEYIGITQPMSEARIWEIKNSYTGGIQEND